MIIRPAYTMGGTGGGGDDTHRRRPRPAQVLVCLVQQLLVIGVGMNGAH